MIRFALSLAAVAGAAHAGPNPAVDVGLTTRSYGGA